MVKLAEQLQQTRNDLEQARLRVAELETQIAQLRSDANLGERIFQYVAQYSWDVYALVSQQGAIEYISPTIRRVLGYSADDFRQFALVSIVHPDDRVYYSQILYELLSSKDQQLTFELRLRHQAGNWVWLQIAASNHLANPDLNTIFFIGRDITTQKNAQQEMQLINERYRAISELMSDYAFLYRVEPDGEIVREWVTGSYIQITGYGIDESFADGSFGLYIPADRDRVKADIQLTLAGQTVSGEYRIRTRAGGERWLRITRKPVWDEQEKRVVRFYGGAQDITDRKRAEQALTESESRFRHIVEDQTDLVCRYDKDLLITFGNRAYCEIRGLTPETIIGHSILEGIPPDGHQQARLYIRSLAQDNPISISVHQTLQLDGTLKWFEWKDRAIFDDGGNILEYQGIGRDVSQQKRIEESLRLSEELYRSLVESSDASITLVDRTGKYLYLNTIAAAPFDTTPDKLVGKTVFDLFPPAQAQSILTDVQAVLQTNRGLTLEAEVTVSGKNVWFRTSMQPVRDATGKPYAVLIHSNDITEKRFTEQAIRSQNEFLQQSRDLIALADTTGKLTFLNHAAAVMMNYESPESMLNMVIPDFHSPENARRVLEEAIPYAIEHGQWRGENLLKTRDGRLVDVDQTIFPIRDSDGMVTHYATIMTDVTERKKTERALQQSEAYLRSLLESQTAFNIRVDMNGNLSYCNKRYEEQFGWVAPSLIGISPLSLVVPEDHHIVIMAVTQCMEHVGKLVRLEVRKPTRDGGSIWTLWEFIAVSGADGVVQEIQCVGFDISKQKEAEAQLKAVNESLEQRVIDRTAELEKVNNRLEAIFNHSGDGILLLDINAGIQQANHAFETLFNLSAPDYLGKPLKSLVSDALSAGIDTVVQQVVASHQKRQIETQSERTDGSLVDIEFSIAPVNRSEKAVTNLVVIIRDISERKHAERALRESQNMLQNVIENIPIRIFWMDKNSVYQGCNTLHAQSLGLTSPREIVGKRARDFSKVDTDLWETDDRRVLETGQGRYNVEELFLDVDGTHRWIHFNKLPLRNIDSQITGILITIEDISARRQAEIAVREERNLLRTLIDAIPDYIFVKDRQHQIVLNNRAHANLLGFEMSEQVIGKTDAELYPDQYTAKFVEDEDKVVNNGESIIASEERTKNLTTGIEIWSHTTKVPLRNLNGEIIGLVGISHDISQIKAAEESLRRSEEQLRESQRMLQLVLDTIPVRVFWKDRNSVMIGCNRLLAADIGFEHVADLLAGERRGQKVVTPEEDSFLADDRAVMESGVPKLDYEEKLTTSGGQTLTIQSSKLPLRNDNGEVIGLIGAYVDITARKQAEAALEQKYRDEAEMQTYLKALHKITLRLTRTETLDAFYRCAVEEGLAQFGFERMGLLLFDPADGTAVGTYGTDALGTLVDEHQIRLDPASLTGILKRTLDRAERFAFDDDADLFANFKWVGRGHNAVAALWNGDVLGWLCIDNAVRHKPITAAQLDILALYALTAGSLLARKRAEFALRDNEERYRLLAENIKDVIVKSTPDGIRTFVSPSSYSLLGYKPEELLGRSFGPIVHPDDVDATKKVIADAFNSNASYFTALQRVRHKDGHYVWIETTNTIIRDPVTGTPLEIVGTGHDVTERKAAEEAIRESELRYRLLAENVKDVIVKLSPQGIQTFVSSSSFSLLGYKPEELVGQSVFSLIHPDDLEASGVAVTNAFASDTSYFTIMQRMRHKDGHFVWVEVTNTIVRDPVTGTPLEIVGTAHDITERKTAEEALRESESRYRLLAENVKDVIIKLDANTHITYASPSCYNLFGYQPDEMIGLQGFDFVHPDDVAPVTNMVNQALAEQKASFVFEERIRHKNGSYIRTEVANTTIFDSVTKQPVEFIGIFRDITERKAAEEALRQSEERLRILFETTPDTICLVNLQGEIVDINSAGLRLIGLLRDQIVGKNVIALNIFNKPVYTEQAAEGLALTGKDGSRTVEYELVRGDGEPIYIEAVTHPISINHEKLQLAIIRDITGRRKAEQALRNSEENYRILINTMSEGVVLQGYDGVIRACNTAAENILGLTADQMMGRSSLDPRWQAIHDDGSPFPGEAHPAMITLRSGVPQSDVVMGVHKPDGTLTWISINARPVFKPGRTEPDAVVTTFADITDRRKADQILKEKLQAEHELQKSLQALHDTTIQLTQIENLDDFYRQVVESGLKRLGFDRMGFFLYDPARNMAIGTYGTDMDGNIQPEHHIQFVIQTTGGMWQSMQKPNRFYFMETAPLEHNREVVGTGWNTSVALWYGDRHLGWLVADNLINRRPASNLQLEILGQYGIYVSASLARRQAEDSLQKTKDQLQAILDHSTASIFMKDLDGRIMLLNRSAETDFDLRPGQWEGKLESEVYAPDSIINYQKTDRQISESGKAMSYEEPFKGRTNWVTKFPIFDHNHKIYAIGGISTDMSERKRYEESLERALKKEQELGELKSRFVSIASHEFRTPLATILASTETLSAYRERMTGDQINDRLAKIHQQVMHMKSIMEDVLQLSRIQAGKVEFKPAEEDLDALCRDVIAEFDEQASYQGRIQYTCSTVPVILRFDSRLMRQVITNLISNALKYSVDNMPIFTSLVKNESEIILRVEDHGIGIPTEDMEHLFEPFHRAKNVGTISGTGLGLSITRQAVEMHGGTITPTSQVDVGTTFEVKLPLSRTV